MSTYVDGRKGRVTLLMVLCLLLVRHPTSARSEFDSGQGGCGPSMQGVDRLRADLGLDNALANRANTLAAAARQVSQPPPANEIQSLTEDSLDGLKDAGDQLEQAAGEIGKQLETMNLPRQQRAWGKAIDDMKTARSKIHYPTRQELTAGALSATGVGPRVMYEAASSYQNTVESLGSIGDQLMPLGGSGIGQGQRDTNPPPNPGPDPWQEWLKRLQAQQARIRNNINGLNAARALQAGEFQQAQRNAAEMRQAVQDIQSVANQLGLLAALCNQATPNQQQPQNAQASQPQPSGGAAAAAAGGGVGAGTKALATLGLVAAGAGGYLIYNALVCPQPPVTSDFSVCAAGSCSACVRMSREVSTYCDCFEKKGEAPAGICGELRTAIDNLAAACMVPKLYTPLPKR